MGRATTGKAKRQRLHAKATGLLGEKVAALR